MEVVLKTITKRNKKGFLAFSLGGSSCNTTILPENIAVGTEFTFPVSNGTKLYNVSIGLDSPGGLPMESHAYKANTVPGW